MTVKLNQIIAAEKGLKGRINDDITKAYHAIQKPALMAGISRNYVPKTEGDDQYPSESTKVQAKATEMLAATAFHMTELMDLSLTKDSANTEACADIVVDGKVLVPKVPVTHLIFLEKQLTDLRTLVSKIPTLDPSEDWHWDSKTSSWATNQTQTLKTKKIPRNHVKAEATDKHPAQVDVYSEDVVVGTWTTTKYSGAIPQEDLDRIMTRIERLATAVKYAREEANSLVVVQRKEGKILFDYLFEK